MQYSTYNEYIPGELKKIMFKKLELYLEIFDI